MDWDCGELGRVAGRGPGRSPSVRTAAGLFEDDELVGSEVQADEADGIVGAGLDGYDGLQWTGVGAN